MVAWEGRPDSPIAADPGGLGDDYVLAVKRN
jgi:hypothetical protein